MSSISSTTGSASVPVPLVAEAVYCAAAAGGVGVAVFY